MRDRYAEPPAGGSDGGRVLPGAARRRAGPFRTHQGLRDRAGRRGAAEPLGSTDWCLNAGGDVLVSGSPVPGSGAAVGGRRSLTRWTARRCLPPTRWADPARGAPWRRRARRSAATTSGRRSGPDAGSSGAEFPRSPWPRRTLSPPMCWRRRSWPAGPRCCTGPRTVGTIDVLAVRRQRGTARDAGVPRLGCRSRGGSAGRTSAPGRRRTTCR